METVAHDFYVIMRVYFWAVTFIYLVVACLLTICYIIEKLQTRRKTPIATQCVNPFRYDLGDPMGE